MYSMTCFLVLNGILVCHVISASPAMNVVTGEHVDMSLASTGEESVGSVGSERYVVYEELYLILKHYSC